ncbi:methyl-accepting chemotaxis protein [Achromobacter sp.]|uniref:methyl-accepting chemotaxis protein n=1 Tax=Achromobacter sp. TaxID=134375 RepID=UPI003D028A78
MFRLFSGLRIRARLSGAFLMVALLGGAIGAFGVWAMARINDMNTELYDVELRGLTAIKDANLQLVYAGRARNSYLAATSEREREATRQQFDTAVSKLDALRERAHGYFHTEEGRRMLVSFKQMEDAWRRDADAFFNEAARLPLMQKDPRAVEIEKQLIASSEMLDALMAKLARNKENATAQSVQAGSDLYARTRDIMVALSFGGVALGILLGWLMTRGIVGPLGQAVNAARQVAAGDLTGDIRVLSRDETGDLMTALKDMNDGLACIVRDVRDGCEGIAAASSEIAQGNADLSQRTEAQAASLEETAASMEQLTSTVQLNANHARQAEQLVTRASSVATRGGEEVDGVVRTMEAIAESSRRIADITNVIDGIAFQTNILALNAAVEAARAGAQGRGFAVVAGEVRTLAQRSAVAAKEINALINESASRVEDGTRQADEAGRTMREVVESVHRTVTLVREIAGASVEQSTGIGQVNQAVAQMDDVTQQNAALVEQAAAAAVSMREQSGRLAQQVRRFKVHAEAVPVGPAGTGATPPPQRVQDIPD